MMIVGPTIVDPWTDAIEKAKTGKQLVALLERLTMLKVLDPACGSGNFLYIAYRKMKRLEMLIRERLTLEFPGEQPRLVHVNAKQFYGMDVKDFAVELAKVSMMIGRKLSIDELHIIDEPPLPLDNLDENFRCVDALMHFEYDGTMPAIDPDDPTEGQPRKDTRVTLRTTWPEADVIIGNPPCLGAKRLKPERGADYVNALRKLYPEVPGMAEPARRNGPRGSRSGRRRAGQ